RMRRSPLRAGADGTHWLRTMQHASTQHLHGMVGRNWVCRSLWIPRMRVLHPTALAQILFDLPASRRLSGFDDHHCRAVVALEHIDEFLPRVGGGSVLASRWVGSCIYCRSRACSAGTLSIHATFAWLIPRSAVKLSTCSRTLRTRELFRA